MKTSANRHHLIKGAIGLLLSASMIASYQAKAELSASTRDLNVEQRPIAEIQAPASDLSVSAWVNHDNNTYTFGEKVVFSVKANKDAYLTILDVGTSGKVHIIFPNQHQSSNRVLAGQTVQVPSNSAPFDFRVDGPAGSELIKVIATTGPTPLFDPQNLMDAGPYKALKKDAGGTAKDLSVVLREQHENQWAEYNKVIKILAPTPVAIPVRAAFELKIRPEQMIYRIGDRVRLFASAARDCHLTLLDVGTSGVVRILFPNRFQQDNMIRAGQTVMIPGDLATVDYKAEGPSGVEAVIGVCRTDNQPIYTGQYNFQQYVYQPWGDSAAVAKDLAVVLRQPSLVIAHTAATFLVVQ